MRAQLFFFLTILFFFLLHLSYIPNDFTWLEHGDIEQKLAIKDPFSIQQIIFQPYANTNFYRPVLTFFLSINYSLFHTNPTGYHITNLILMALIAVISPLFLSKYVSLTNREKLILSLFLCVHPLTWLSSGSISYRPELLVILFSEIFIIFHAKYRLSKKITFHYLSLIFLLLALFSKETAFILLPFLVFSYEFITHKKSLVPYMFFLEELMCIGIFILLRYKVMGALWPLRNYNWNLLEQIGTRVVVIGRLLVLLISPIVPHFSDSTRIVSLISSEAFMSLLFISFLVYFGIRTKNIYIKVGIFLSLILLTPALNIFALPRFFSPHYALFSLIPALLIFVGIYRDLSIKIRSLFIFILFLVFFVMSYETLAGGFRFKNDYTLFSPDVLRDSHFLEGQYYLGDYYYSKKNLADSEFFYRNSLYENNKIIAYVDKTSAQIKLANILRLRGKFNDALDFLVKAEKDSPRSVLNIIQYDKAVLYFETKQYDKSLSELQLRSTNWNTDMQAVSLLVAIYNKQGKKKEALSFLDNIFPNVNSENKKNIIQLKKQIESD
jgi:tetratricopeptide (TPR) repeat protein